MHHFDWCPVLEIESKGLILYSQIRLTQVSSYWFHVYTIFRFTFYKILTYIPSHPHLAGDTRIFMLSPALKLSPAFTRILLKSPVVTRILHDGDKITQTNLFAGRKEQIFDIDLFKCCQSN